MNNIRQFGRWFWWEKNYFFIFGKLLKLAVAYSITLPYIHIQVPRLTQTKMAVWNQCLLSDVSAYLHSYSIVAGLLLVCLSYLG